jgi:methylated-DNA-[protein]-cysteine S-methyltransferase
MLDCTEVTVVDELTLRLVSSDSGLRAIEFQPWEGRPDCRPGTHPIASEAVRQLRAYFAGELRRFDLLLDMQGTPFQLRVWRELERIPYGETRSYTQIATAIGAPHAVRAVGAANGANPIPIVVPCHRVIGASGRLVGYGGGLPLKKRLLALEGALAQPLGY